MYTWCAISNSMAYIIYLLIPGINKYGVQSPSDSPLFILMCSDSLKYRVFLVSVENKLLNELHRRFETRGEQVKCIIHWV